MSRTDADMDQIGHHQDELRRVKNELQRALNLLSKSVRVEMVYFPCDRMVSDPELGCRFIMGENHVVAEWRGDGVAADTVFVEGSELTYFQTTTPIDRCVRMVLEMVHWEVACAMLAGPGDGQLVEWNEIYGGEE